MRIREEVGRHGWRSIQTPNTFFILRAFASFDFAKLTLQVLVPLTCSSIVRGFTIDSKLALVMIIDNETSEIFIELRGSNNLMSKRSRRKCINISHQGLNAA